MTTAAGVSALAGFVSFSRSVAPMRLRTAPMWSRTWTAAGAPRVEVVLGDRRRMGRRSAPRALQGADGWRLVRFHEDNRRELYDTSTDPEERIDLASSRPDKCEALAKLLDTWLKETGAQMPVPNPAFDKSKDRGPQNG